MATLLVTGASGFLGAVLSERASAAGWDVVGAYRTTRPAAVVKGWRCDIRDAVSVSAMFADVAPDAVIHTAYRQDGEDAAAVNVGGSAAVAAGARRAGSRLVHLSSDAVFRGDLGRPLREDDALDPVTPYGMTKARAEEAVRAAMPTAALVRTSLIYGGPGFALSKHEQLALAAARRERAVTFFTNEVRCPVQVGDLADALLEIVQGDATGPLHVAGADAVDRHAFAELVAEAHGEDPTALVAGDSGPGRPGDCTLDCSAARALLTTRLRGVRQVLGAR